METSGQHRCDAMMKERNLNGIFSRGTFRRANLTKFKHYQSMMSRPIDDALYDDSCADILKEQGFDIEGIYEPRNIYDPEKLYETLKLYGPEVKPSIIKDKHLKAGIDLAYKVFAKPKDLSQDLEVLQDNKLISGIKMNKSSGLPLLTTKAESLVYSLDRLDQVISGVKSPNPCIAYKRTQANNKTRLVWGYPLEMTLMEAQYARPLIDNFLKVRTPMAFGLKKPELGALLEIQVRSKKNIVALDYSKFDTSIDSTLISYAFNILKTWFSESDIQNHGWDQIVKYFISTPIVMPDGQLYLGKRHGVPSGSYFTQLIDSIVNVILIGAVSSKFNLRLSWRNLFVLGDDCIFGTNNKISLKQVADFLLHHFGIKVNVLKSSVDKLEFLGATWVNGLPTIEIEKLLQKAIFPESFRNYKDVGKLAGARNVLVSLAGQYISGHRLSPMVWKNDYGSVPFVKDIMDINPRFMTGSDRFHYSEKFGDSLNSFNKSNIVDLAYRMLT